MTLALDNEGIKHSSEFWACWLLAIFGSFVYVLWETDSIIPPLQYLQILAVPPVHGSICLSFFNVKLLFNNSFFMFYCDRFMAFIFLWESCLLSCLVSFGYLGSFMFWNLVTYWLNSDFNNLICLTISGIYILWLCLSLDLMPSFNEYANFSISFIFYFMFWVSKLFLY